MTFAVGRGKMITPGKLVAFDGENLTMDGTDLGHADLQDTTIKGFQMDATDGVREIAQVTVRLYIVRTSDRGSVELGNYFRDIILEIPCVTNMSDGGLVHFGVH
jgi:hypothetical protein